MAELYAADIPGFTNFMRMTPEFFEMIKTRLEPRLARQATNYKATRFFMPAGAGTGFKPRTSVGPLPTDVGVKESHLLVDPGLPLGHFPWGLARLLLGELAITSSLGLNFSGKPTSDIKGLQFCRDFCPESLLPLSVMETSMILVIQLWVLQLHNGIFLDVSECSTNPGSLGC